MRFFLACLLVFVSGCASQGRGNTTIGIDESKFNKTIVGALAGAAGGATIGALAANDTGEGIAIGALTGVIVGAGVGAILAKNDLENDSLNEQSFQQKEKIKQQQRDIDYLRSRDAEHATPKNHGDGVGEENLPLIPATDGPAKSHDVSHNQPPAEGVKPKLVKQETATPSASTPPAATISSQPSARSSMNGKYPYNENRPSGSRTGGTAVTTASASTAAVATTTVAAKSATPTPAAPAAEPTAKVVKETAPKIETAKVADKVTDPAKPDVSPTLKKVSAEVPAAPTSVTPPTGQAGCKEAVKEAEQGLKSSSDADRLFYLRRASRLCPSEATYHVELGRMLSSLGKSNEAKQELKHALTLDPKNQTARDELSIVENSSGKK